MKKLLLLLVPVALLAAAAPAPAARPVCGIGDARGTCFVTLELADDWLWIGELTDLDGDGDRDFYLVWFPGARDSWLRFDPSGGIFFHGMSRRAPFIYCPDSRYLVFGDPSDPADDFRDPSQIDPTNLPDSAVSNSRWGARFEGCIFGAGRAKANIARDSSDFSMGPGLVVTLRGMGFEYLSGDEYEVRSVWGWPAGRALWNRWSLTATPLP